MKTILTFLLAVFAVVTLNAQCETFFTSNVDGNTVSLQAYFTIGADTIFGESQFQWQINDETLTGDVVTYTFLDEGYYNICLTGSGMGCTSTFCDEIYIGSGQEQDSCNMFISYDITHASSADIADGAIDITVQGGTAPYTYYWSNEETTEDIFELLPGTYTVAINDNEDCSFTISFFIAGMDDTTYNDTTVVDYFYVNAYYEFAGDADCTAIVYAEVIGGTAPYTYYWNNEQYTSSFDGACGNEYYCVEVMDAEGLFAEACVYVDYFGDYQDSTGNQNDPFETIIDTCLDEIEIAEIIDYLIEDESITVTWEFTNSSEEVIHITITYPTQGDITAGTYDFYLYINCGDLKSLTSYSDKIIISEEEILTVLPYSQNISYSIFPNPVNDVLNIEMYSDKFDNANLQIINIAGQVVYSELLDISSGYNNHAINVNNLIKGMYFVQIVGSESYETMKFVK